MSCVHLALLCSQSSWFAGVSFGARGKDSASSPYRRSTLPLQQRKLPLYKESSTRLDPWGPGAVDIATRRIIHPGSEGLARARPRTDPLATRKQGSAGLGPVMVHPTYPFGRWAWWSSDLSRTLLKVGVRGQNLGMGTFVFWRHQLPRALYSVGKSPCDGGGRGMQVLNSCRDRIEGAYRSGKGGKSLLGDPRSELRLGREREKEKVRI